MTGKIMLEIQYYSCLENSIVKYTSGFIQKPILPRFLLKKWYAENYILWYKGLPLKLTSINIASIFSLSSCW